MRRLALALALSCACGTAFAALPDAQQMAPITAFMDAFNKGDADGAAKTHAAIPELVIVDEVPPFVWRGAGAFQAWAADLDKDAKKNGITDQSVTLGKPLRAVTDGDRAYVVVPAVYAFKQNGVALREAAHMTFTLRKGGSGWLIDGWTWTGPDPSPAK